MTRDNSIPQSMKDSFTRLKTIPYKTKDFDDWASSETTSEENTVAGEDRQSIPVTKGTFSFFPQGLKSDLSPFLSNFYFLIDRNWTGHDQPASANRSCRRLS